MHQTSFLTFLALASGASLPAQRVDITISPSRDATLYEDTLGSLSNGGGPGLFTGLTGSNSIRRALVAFDIAAAVPAGARIVFAQLRLTISQAPFTGSAVDMTAHRVLANWGEGTTVAPGPGGTGGIAQAGDATWLHTFHPGSFWSAPGGDFATLVAARVSMPLSGSFVLGTTSAMIADVQDWLDGRRPNHGWILRGDETVAAAGNARRLHSRESTPGLEPRLSIGYVPAGNALPVGIGCIGSNGLPFLQTITGLPIGGNTVQLSMSQGIPGELAVTVMSFGISATPYDIEPGCSMFLELLPWPSFGIRLLDASGQWTDSYHIAPDPGLFGAPFACQSFALDGALPRGYVLSNAHLVVLR